VDLMDFESIPIFFSEEEIEELQADIDKRRSRRLAREGRSSGVGGAELVYSPNVPEED
jgi:hypothetical protein